MLLVGRIGIAQALLSNTAIAQPDETAAILCFASSISGHAATFPLNVHLVWGIGDRGTTVSVFYDLKSADDGSLRVEEKTNAGFVQLRGFLKLSKEEVNKIVAAEKAADIWSLPENMPRDTKIRKGQDGIDTVLICYSYMKLSEVCEAARISIKRECPEDKKIVNVP